MQLRWSTFAAVLLLACSSGNAPNAGDFDAGSTVDAGATGGTDCGNVLIDPENCGTCGYACADTAICVQGECQPTASCLALGCPSARTWCEASTGICRSGCASDAPCGAGRVCDTSTHLCVPVPTNCLIAACPIGHFCDTTNARCMVGCQSTQDCPASDLCAEGQCVPRPLKCPDGVCPGGQYCKAGTCATGCSETSPCPGGGACDLQRHTCGERPPIATCITSGCPENQYCDVQTKACRLGCGGSAACKEAGQYCDLSSHTCRTTPTTCPEQGCPYGSHCASGRCVSGCTQADDCGAGVTCNTAKQQCEAFHSNCAETGCPPGERCSARTLTCVRGCIVTTDCGAGEVCDPNSSQCLQAPRDCMRDPCLETHTCDPGDGACKRTCSDEGGCAQHETCDDATDICVSTCSPYTCPLGNYCDESGACVPGCGPGYICPNGGVCDNALHVCLTITDPCAMSCTDGTYCDLAQGRCVVGCSIGFSCEGGERCDHAARACYVPNTCAPSGSTACDGQCVDLSLDSQNCGFCRNRCEGSCVGGQCSAITP